MLLGKRLRAAVPASFRTWVRLRVDPRARRSANRAATLPNGRPNFGTLVTQRRSWLFEHLPLASAELHYDIFTKESQRRLAARLGLTTAATLRSGLTLAEALDHVRRADLDHFAIKPDSSHNAIGFRALVREDGGYRELRKGRRRSLDGWRRELAREYRQLERPDAWVLEELLLPAGGAIAPVDDVKFFCFGGRVELIVHLWRFPHRPWKQANWYHRDWTPVTEPVRRSKPDPHHDHPPPPSGDRLLEIAERAASRLCYPFIRIDLYDTSRGVVLGEFTPGPGGRYDLTPAWDDRFSQRWHEAAADLVDDLRSGRIEPLLPERDPTDGR